MPTEYDFLKTEELLGKGSGVRRVSNIGLRPWALATGTTRKRYESKTHLG